MTYSLSNNCAKNLCKRTVLVQPIIENVWSRFLWRCVYITFDVKPRYTNRDKLTPKWKDSYHHYSLLTSMIASFINILFLATVNRLFMYQYFIVLMLCRYTFVRYSILNSCPEKAFLLYNFGRIPRDANHYDLDVIITHFGPSIRHNA